MISTLKKALYKKRKSFLYNIMVRDNKDFSQILKFLYDLGFTWGGNLTYPNFYFDIDLKYKNFILSDNKLTIRFDKVSEIGYIGPYQLYVYRHRRYTPNNNPPMYIETFYKLLINCVKNTNEELFITKLYNLNINKPKKENLSKC